MMKAYYYLTKPGIIYGNAVTTVAGFFLASKGEINFALLLSTLIGLSLIIASGCVFNNFFDRVIDVHMERTKNRALVTGKISGRNAIIFGTVLGILGSLVLALFTNHLTLAIALVGLFVYVCIYTPLKRKTLHGTLIGAIAGAVPPVVGYTAVTNHLDRGAWLFFFILVFWQMPHFYAIAIRRLDEYRAAAIPVMPAVKGIFVTKVNILIYILGFFVLTILLKVYAYAGNLYLVVAILLSVVWLWFAITGLKLQKDNKLWARKMFLTSLVVLTLLCLSIVLDSFIKSRI